MKTSELIKALRQLDDDGKLEVLIASDEEGNGFGTIGDESFDFIGDSYLTIYPYSVIDPFEDDFQEV